MADAIGGQRIAEGLTRDCLDPWTYVEFRPDGDVAPCCVRPGVGNIGRDGIAKILNGPESRRLRKSLLEGSLDSYCALCLLRPPVTPIAFQEKVRAALAEVRLPANFDAQDYLAANPGLAAGSVDPTTHFLYHGRIEGRSVLAADRSLRLTVDFDPELYLLANPDVVGSGMSPKRHFLEIGQFEGRRLRPERASGG